MDYSIKELPKSERPREKLCKKGVNSLTDVELLSIILRTGISGKNVKELSSEILNSYSLSSLSTSSLGELKEFEGISSVKASQLKAVGELSLRMQNERKEKIASFSDVKDCVQDMKFLKKEKARLFLLSSGNELLHKKEFGGKVDSVAFQPQKIFRLALKHNASAAILVHNHPSGKPEPTQQDISTTEELIKVGNQLGIELLDHIIVGKTVLSMRKDSSVEF